MDYPSQSVAKSSKDFHNLPSAGRILRDRDKFSDSALLHDTSECIISSTCDSDVSLSGSEYVPESEFSDSDDPSPPIGRKTGKLVTHKVESTCKLNAGSPSPSNFGNLVTNKVESTCKLNAGSPSPSNSCVTTSYSSCGENFVVGVEKKSKKNCCFYCGKLVSKIGRHLQSHTTEREIIEISSKKDKQEKALALKELRLMGNYRYNLECLERGSGSIIVMRAPTFKCKAADFVPCPSCLGFVLKRELYKHSRECPFKIDGAISNPVEEAKLLLLPKHLELQGSEELNRFILNKLRNDSVKCRILDDPLIIAFGQSQMKRLRAAKGDKYVYLCQRLRLLGRLLIECERIRGISVSLDDLLKPVNFDLLICTVQNMTEAESKPKSTGLKIGMAIRKCCILAKCLAIKLGNDVRRMQADDFLALMDGEWSDLLSSSLLRELYDRKLNKDTVLPVTSDLMKLNSLINERICKATQDMVTFPSEENYFRLAKVTLCKIIVFNKRRSGEVSRISVSDYLKRPDWSSKQNEEISKSLCGLERKLADRMDLIKVSGKRGRHVPILLTRDMVKAMDLLVRDRCHVNIKKSNNYFFATTGDKYLRGHEVLHAIAQEAGLSDPSAMTSTNLRKYIATVSQIIALDKEELEWLADHLGHSIEVHRDFYRLQESTLEMCKVSKLLMAIESGSIHKFVGRKLSDIQIENFDEEDDCELHSQNDGSRKLRAQYAELSELQVENNDQSELQVQNEHSEPEVQNDEYNEPQVENKHREPQVKKQEHNKLQIQKDEQHKLQSQNEPSFDLNVSRKCRKDKQKWDPAVRNIALKFFKKCLLTKKVPGKQECEKFIDIYKVKNRQWKDIKYLVYNEMKKKA